MTSPISDILLKSLEIPETDGIYTQPITETHRKWASDIEQAILSIIAEAIGEDDPEETNTGTSVLSRNLNTQAFYQNKLRHEIRQKLGIGGKG